MEKWYSRYNKNCFLNRHYTHTGTKPFRVDKLEVRADKILSVLNQKLVVKDSLKLNDGAEIRLVGTSQLIQTHEGTAKVTGTY